MRLLRFHSRDSFNMGLYMCTAVCSSGPFNRPLISESTRHYDRASQIRSLWRRHLFAFGSYSQMAKWIWTPGELTRIMTQECALTELIVPAGHFFVNERQAIFDADAVIAKRKVELPEARDLFIEARMEIDRLMAQA